MCECVETFSSLFFFFFSEGFNLHEVYRVSCYNMFTRYAKSLHHAQRSSWMSETCSSVSHFAKYSSESGTTYFCALYLCVCVSCIRKICIVRTNQCTKVQINVLVDVCMCSTFNPIDECVCVCVQVCARNQKSMHVCLFTALRECFRACCNAHRCIFTHCLCIKESVCVHLLECEQVYFLPAAVSHLYPSVCLCQCASFIILCAFLNTRSNLHVQTFMSSRSKVYDSEIVSVIYLYQYLHVPTGSS